MVLKVESLAASQEALRVVPVVERRVELQEESLVALRVERPEG